MDEVEVINYEEQKSQASVIRWFNLAYSHIANLLYHIPNGQNVGPKVGARLKNMGLRPGVPDLCLSIPKMDGRTVIPSLFIEMKSSRGQLTQQQRQMKELLETQGHRVVVCRSFEEAINAIEEYLALPHPQ